MKKIFLAAFLSQSLLSGCAQVAITDLNSPQPVISKQIDLNKKKILFGIDVSVDDMDHMDTIKSNRLMHELTKIISDDLQEQYNAKIFTDYRDNDFNYALHVQISEKNEYPETGIDKFLRSISFGFRAQEVRKKTDFSIKVYTVAKTLNSHTEYTNSSVYNYTAPMLIIPLNLDQNPQTYSLQIKEYRNRILNLLKQIEIKAGKVSQSCKGSGQRRARNCDGDWLWRNSQ